ncbi:MAG: hypothetical protein EA353_06855 [Puniceicoccaceae bacterium]|nr:MAG: hypothetical protein EA353_06855 [Puniceicoccaceae bacterium]
MPEQMGQKTVESFNQNAQPGPHDKLMDEFGRAGWADIGRTKESLDQFGDDTSAYNSSACGKNEAAVALPICQSFKECMAGFNPIVSQGNAQGTELDG